MKQNRTNLYCLGYIYRTKGGKEKKHVSLIDVYKADTLKTQHKIGIKDRRKSVILTTLVWKHL